MQVTVSIKGKGIDEFRFLDDLSSAQRQYTRYVARAKLLPESYWPVCVEMSISLESLIIDQE